MTRKRTDNELDASRCSARSKASGERCRRWAVAGAAVCTVHGAGAPRRRAFPGGPDGRVRQDPRTARLSHGLYSKRLRREVGDVVAEFVADDAALFDLKAMTARLWVLLMRGDAVEEAASGGDLRDPTVAAEILRAVDSVRRILRELAKAIALHHKLTRRDSGLSEREVVAVVCLVVSKVREIAADARIPREKIAESLTAWIEASAVGHPGQ